MARLTRSSPRAAIGLARAAAALAVGFALTGCPARVPGPPKPVAPVRIAVAVASDLQEAWPAIAARFLEVAKTDLSPTFGASGQLAEQIRQGAPFDIFLSADLGYVEKLAGTGDILPGSVAPYALGELALVVRSELAGRVRSLADLAGPDVKSVAIANPEFAPYGRAARTVLDRAGLSEALAPKLVRAESVRMALTHVVRGDADTGLVGRASIQGNPGVAVIPIDPAFSDPIVQGLGITKQAAEPKSAESFRRFLLNEEGRAILAKAGYRLPVLAGVR